MCKQLVLQAPNVSWAWFNRDNRHGSWCVMAIHFGLSAPQIRRCRCNSNGLQESNPMQGKAFFPVDGRNCEDSHSIRHDGQRYWTCFTCQVSPRVHISPAHGGNLLHSYLLPSCRKTFYRLQLCFKPCLHTGNTTERHCVLPHTIWWREYTAAGKLQPVVRLFTCAKTDEVGGLQVSLVNS